MMEQQTIHPDTPMHPTLSAPPRLHPAIASLRKMIGEIVSNSHIGFSATGSFWFRRSFDCFFLEFSDEPRPAPTWKFTVTFFPHQPQSAETIYEITLSLPNDVWIISCGSTEIQKLGIRHSPQCEYHWLIRDHRDESAELIWLSIKGQDGGEVQYVKSLEVHDPGWCRGTTCGFPWTEGPPVTLTKDKDPSDLIHEAHGVLVIPSVSIKNTVDHIVRFGKLEECLAQLKARKSRG